MKPFGQTFFINEPLPPVGVPGVFITRIDVYFKSVDTSQGVELQIRETENGVPTQNMVLYGSKILNPGTPGDRYSKINTKNGDNYEIAYYSTEAKKFVVWGNPENLDNTKFVGGPLASDDASVPTPFIFDTPVFLESSKTYAFVIIPLGGAPNYDVWTCSVSGTDGSIKDVTTGAVVYTNQDSGDLFLSTNEETWSKISNETVKYTIDRKSVV